MAVRLKDIARDLGVSLITVSKALRGKNDISEETRQRVLTRMAELNYRPNMLARGLASGKSYIVGLVVPDLLHPFFAEFAKSLNGVLRRNNYGLILASSEENPELEQQEIQNVLARGIDALVIASCQPALRGFYGIEDQSTPFVLIDRDFPHLRAHFVGTDDYAAGRLATRHLVQVGRRRIAHIAGPDLSPSADRMRGYKDELTASGILVRQSYIISSSYVEELGEVAGNRIMRKLLDRRPRPDAVFCYNDLTAIGAMSAVMSAGLAIPDDIAFVGCGNVRYSEHLRTPLSSVDQSTSELGEQAGKLALELIGSDCTAPRQIRLQPRLIIRASSQKSAPPARGTSVGKGQSSGRIRSSSRR
ncbi:MAG: LacI family DNA-binding transcriptional regulator [Acidobacteriota bacterium]|nr:LacI family DNA-binding transcriptional regulator [Acidobacteriota bacterium]